MGEIFTFEGNQHLRTIKKDGETWFVAADVCQVLGVQNHKMAVKVLDQDEKGVYNLYSPGGLQLTWIISESGLYTIMLRSNGALKPGTLAHRFRRWVTHDVLPAIRQTGRYDKLHDALADMTLPPNADPEVVDAMWRLRFERLHAKK